MDTSRFGMIIGVNRLPARSYTDAILDDNQKIAFEVLKHIHIFRLIPLTSSITRWRQSELKKSA
jgi:hypothetical protein